MTPESMAPGDRKLMAEASTGSVDAFGELYDRYSARAYRLALSVCHDHGRAQDAVHDAFLSIWKNRASYSAQRGTVATWLLTTVRYRAIDITRRSGNRPTPRVSDEVLENRPAPDDVYEQALRSDETQRLQASLALLPDTQQEVIILAYYGQLSHTEIATRLRLPVGTVKGRMRLGMDKLRVNIARDAA
ncbi:MAG: sigma-70 family RNA polymerase sigma factor [Actinomycetota bacterium]|nr:sigma-70 family RNA polymerase sigma factor [Actinomycetota bacterium]